MHQSYKKGKGVEVAIDTYAMSLRAFGKAIVTKLCLPGVFDL